MKTYLSFNDQSEDDREKLKDILQATNMKVALFDISQEVFRPARKHGYLNNSRLNVLIKDSKVEEAIGLLEVIFHEILSERSVDIE